MCLSPNEPIDCLAKSPRLRNDPLPILLGIDVDPRMAQQGLGGLDAGFPPIVGRPGMPQLIRALAGIYRPYWGRGHIQSWSDGPKCDYTRGEWRRESSRVYAAVLTDAWVGKCRLYGDGCHWRVGLSWSDSV